MLWVLLVPQSTRDSIFRVSLTSSGGRLPGYAGPSAICVSGQGWALRSCVVGARNSVSTPATHQLPHSARALSQLQLISHSPNEYRVNIGIVLISNAIFFMISVFDGVRLTERIHAHIANIHNSHALSLNQHSHSLTHSFTHLLTHSLSLTLSPNSITLSRSHFPSHT